MAGDADESGILCGYAETAHKHISFEKIQCEEERSGIDIWTEDYVPPDERPNVIGDHNFHIGTENCPYCGQALHMVQYGDVYRPRKRGWIANLLGRPSVHDAPRFAHDGTANGETLILDESYVGSVLSMEEEHSRVRIKECLCCGWWFVGKKTRMVGISSGPYDDADVYYGLAKSYRVEDADVPIRQLIRHLSKHPRHMELVHSRAFELVVQSCMREFYGDCEVVHLGRTGDGGVDLLVVRNNLDDVLVQVKRRTNIDKSEGVEAIRSLNGVLFREGKAHGAVVTSAARYTAAALEEVELAIKNNKNYKLDLFAFDDIRGLLSLSGKRPSQYWTGVLNNITRHLASPGH